MKRRKIYRFLKELAHVPIVSSACEKIGISRNTVYRWRKDIPGFAQKMDDATLMGNDSISDLAESKLIASIQDKKMTAIRYWLDNNNAKYLKPREKTSWNGKIPHPTAGSFLLAKTIDVKTKEHQNVIIEIVDMSHNKDFEEFDELYKDEFKENKKP